MDVCTLITSKKKKNETTKKPNNHIIHFQTFKEKNLN